MKNGSITVTTSLLVKTLVISFILLTFAFGAGLIIGKTDASVGKGIGSKDESQLSACSFKLQEVTAKHISLVEFAQTKGLMTSDGKIDNDVVCTYIKKNEPLTEEESPHNPEENPAENKENEIQKKTAQNTTGNICRFSIQLFSDTNKQSALAAQKKHKISGTHLVEGIVDGRSWYRIRYGCFENRADAENKLPEIRETVVDAIVVTN